MLRRTTVALGLAVLLSLLFPVRAVLEQGGVDPLQLRLPGIDLAALCAVAALLPAMALSRLGQLDRRMPRWNVWLALLAFFSIAFVLLHVSWSLELASVTLRDLLADAAVPLPVGERSLLRAAEFATRVGVLVSLTGVLLNLQAAPDEDAPAPRRRGRR